MKKKELLKIVFFFIVLSINPMTTAFSQNTKTIVNVNNSNSNSNGTVTVDAAIATVNAIDNSKDVAEKVANEFFEMKKPNKKANEFEHWKYNAMAHAAAFCWNQYKKNEKAPQKLLNYRPTKAGNFSIPNKNEDNKFCESLASKGLKPVCIGSTLWVKNVKRKNDLPLDYLQVYRNKPVEVEGVINCYLNQDQINKQTYAGPMTADWKEKPALRTLNTVAGPKIVEFGTMMITAPNTPGIDGISTYSEPKLTVVIGD